MSARSAASPATVRASIASRASRRSAACGIGQIFTLEPQPAAARPPRGAPAAYTTTAARRAAPALPIAAATALTCAKYASSPGPAQYATVGRIACSTIGRSSTFGVRRDRRRATFSPSVEASLRRALAAEHEREPRHVLDLRLEARRAKLGSPRAASARSMSGARVAARRACTPAARRRDARDATHRAPASPSGASSARSSATYAPPTVRAVAVRARAPRRAVADPPRCRTPPRAAASCGATSPSGASDIGVPAGGTFALRSRSAPPIRATTVDDASSEIGVVRRGPEHRRGRDARRALDRVGQRERADRLAPRVDRPAEQPGLLTGRDDDPAFAAHALQTGPRPRPSRRARARASSMSRSSPRSRARSAARRRQPSAPTGRRRSHSRGALAPLQQQRERRAAERFGQDADVGHCPRAKGTVAAAEPEGPADSNNLTRRRKGSPARTPPGSGRQPRRHLWYGSPRAMVPARYSCSASTSRASSCGSVQGQLERARRGAAHGVVEAVRAADHERDVARRVARLRRGASRTRTTSGDRRARRRRAPARPSGTRSSSRSPSRRARLGGADPSPLASRTSTDGRAASSARRASRTPRSPPRDADRAASRRRRRRGARGYA